MEINNMLKFVHDEREWHEENVFWFGLESLMEK